MGSTTEFNGTLNVVEGMGILNETIWYEFNKTFGYAIGKRKNNVDIYKIEGITTDTGYTKLVLAGSWKNVEMGEAIKAELAFFANKGIFFKGRIHCRHEYGEMYAVDVDRKTIQTLDGYVEYKKSAKKKTITLTENVVYV